MTRPPQSGVGWSWTTRASHPPPSRPRCPTERPTRRRPRARRSQRWRRGQCVRASRRPLPTDWPHLRLRRPGPAPDLLAALLQRIATRPRKAQGEARSAKSSKSSKVLRSPRSSWAGSPPRSATAARAPSSPRGHPRGPGSCRVRLRWRASVCPLLQNSPVPTRSCRASRRRCRLSRRCRPSCTASLRCSSMAAVPRQHGQTPPSRRRTPPARP
mmetsp:Transcript_5256/g.16230  ORF Transcript_5256/g.16230 Transcript_5256/m.16230 type:complete len:214 (-) Transcript_5256:1069-1710(-)